MIPVTVALGLALAIGGTATWYDYHEGQAAAGPALRSFLGPDWRGSLVRVCAGECITVRLTDWMRADRLIDLDDADFGKLAPLSRGVLSVEVARGND